MSDMWQGENIDKTPYPKMDCVSQRQTREHYLSLQRVSQPRQELPRRTHTRERK